MEILRKIRNIILLSVFISNDRRIKSTYRDIIDFCFIQIPCPVNLLLSYIQEHSFLNSIRHV